MKRGPRISHGAGTVPKPKPAHTGHTGPAIGPTVYLIVRHDGKMVGAEPTRHEAVSEAFELHSCDDYTIEPVPIGAIPLTDYTGHR